MYGVNFYIFSTEKFVGGHKSLKMAIDIGRKCFYNFFLIQNSRFFATTRTRMSAKVIDGKKIAGEIQKELKLETEKWVGQGNRRPSLIAILVGEDPASSTYVANKMKVAKDVGINSKTEKFPHDLPESELLKKIEELNGNDDIDGILVQLPLPKHINEKLICSAIAHEKDVDGFHILNLGSLVLGQHIIAPCTPAGVMELIKRCGVETFGKNAVVCGRSKNVGLPIAMMLHSDGKDSEYSMDSTTTICHRYTPKEELSRFTKSADIIVSATGVPHLITKDMIKPGVCIIDVGITRITDPTTGKTKLVGDVDFDNCKEIAGYITPVPGGVGPMTVTMLMKNTILAAQIRAQNKKSA